MCVDDSPFKTGQPRKLIVHCCHHKAGTVWFNRIFKKLARTYNLKFQNQEQKNLCDKTDVFIQKHSLVNVPALPDHVGSHMIRDPRDIVVSGYFYHLWTNEKWANQPQKALKGRSYKENLNRLNQHDGLMAEIGRIQILVSRMVSWNYDDPGFLELKYEDVIENEGFYFQKLFTHYGFHEKAIKKACEIAESLSFKNVVNRKKEQNKSGRHLRSGKSGQWLDFFSNEHKQYFKYLYPDLLPKLGYEKDDDW